MIFEFQDYRPFLRLFFAQLPKKGRGQARKLAAALRVHPVVISQVLAGTRHLTPEQALEAATYLGLDERSTEYFSTLVLKARAGTKQLEQYLEKKLAALRAEASELKNRIPKYHKLSEEEIGTFYSNWYYSGVRLLTSIPAFDHIDSIAARLSLSRNQVATIVAYLLETGLCKQDTKGKLSMGVTSTFVEKDSPYVNAHHRNWRIKALEAQIYPKDSDLFYSNPCTLSAKDKEQFCEELRKLIASFSKRVKDSPSEKLACLNIDWFDV